MMEVMQQMVGGREMTQIESDNDETLKSGESEEEKAYQQIKDELGIDPVRIATNSLELEFISAEIDEMLQTAVVLYNNKDGKVISYIISISYSDSSFGVDIEDELVREFQQQKGGLNITVKEYNIVQNNEKLYSAEFNRQDVYYQITGSVDEADMKKIINNLSFL